MTWYSQHEMMRMREEELRSASSRPVSRSEWSSSELSGLAGLVSFVSWILAIVLFILLVVAIVSGQGLDVDGGDWGGAATAPPAAPVSECSIWLPYGDPRCFVEPPL